MFQLCGVLAGVLTVLSYIPYTRDIILGRVKPERASWLIWSIAITIAVLTQYVKGATQSLWFPIGDALGCMFTFVLALKYGMGGLLKRDIVALFALVGGLAIWAITDNVIYALLITIAIDADGSVLTIWKTLEEPYSETYTAWVVIWIASLFAVVSVGKLSTTLLIYPVYMFIVTGCIVGSIFVGRRIMKPVRELTDLPLSADGTKHGPAMLGEPYWSSNPVQVGISTTLSVPIEYTVAAVQGGEYIGVRDPGVGNGIAMVLTDGHLKAEIVPKVIGAHPLNIRARDANGIWSEFTSTTFTVLPEPSSNSSPAESSQLTAGSL